MTQALHGLWEGWMHSEGAANNLRIFVEGVRIHPLQVRFIVGPSLSFS
jgi:hypothetical protein